MIKIAPSLLSCDFTKMGEEVADIEKAGADYLHLDVMDGIFVTNITFGMPVIEALKKKAHIPFDVHLMITEPERYIERFIQAGADLLTVHYEATSDLSIALDTIRLHGCRVGLSVKPATPVEVLYPYLDAVDVVLIMTVEPGYGGQSLIPACLDKVRALRRYCTEHGKKIEIEVDGGINAETAPEAVAAGAGILVAGSAVFEKADRAAAIAALR